MIIKRCLWATEGDAKGIPHNGKALHRSFILTDAFGCEMEFRGIEVCLVQLELRGLWHISPLEPNEEIESAWDEELGPMPLRLALTRVRIGV